MPKRSHYSPRINRFLVSVLYHEAKRRQIPMTKLTDELLKKQLAGLPSWAMAQESKIAEEPPPYSVSNR